MSGSEQPGVRITERLIATALGNAGNGLHAGMAACSRRMHAKGLGWAGLLFGGGEARDISSALGEGVRLAREA